MTTSLVELVETPPQPLVELVETPPQPLVELVETPPQPLVELVETPPKGFDKLNPQGPAIRPTPLVIPANAGISQPTHGRPRSWVGARDDGVRP